MTETVNRERGTTNGRAGADCLTVRRSAFRVQTSEGGVVTWL